MALEASAILSGGTLSATGGTSKTFTRTGQRVLKGAHYADVNAAYDVRHQFIVEYTPPVWNKATKQFGKENTSLSYMIPQVLSDGTIVFNVWRLKQEVHPLFTDRTLLRTNGLQCGFDTDFNGLWLAGQVS